MANFTAKIDVNKIDKSRLFKGKDGLYLDLVFVETKSVGQYGDTHLVKQSISKEERESGVQLPIIGNLRPMGGGNTGGGQQQAPKRTDDWYDDPIPF